MNFVCFRQNCITGNALCGLEMGATCVYVCMHKLHLTVELCYSTLVVKDQLICVLTFMSEKS